MAKHAQSGNRAKFVPLATSLAIVSLITATSVQASSFDVDGQALKFLEGKVNGTGSTIEQTDGDGSSSDDIGNNVSEDDFVDFYDVITIGGQQIDARVTVTGLQDMKGSSDPDELENIDEAVSTTGWNDYMIIRADYQVGQGQSHADLKMEFFTDLAGTPSSVSLENLKMTTFDLDGYQFVELNNFDTYQVSTNTVLDVSEPRTGFTRFIDSEGNSMTGSDSREKGRATVTFNSTSEINFRVGQNLPDGVTDTGSSLFFLDFSVGQSWGGTEGEVQTAPPLVVAEQPAEETPPAPATYTGPIPKLIDSCVPETGGVATLSGERLAKVTSASVESNEVTILDKTDTQLRMEFPAMEPGTYDVEYGYASSGKLTHLSSLKVCEQRVEPKQNFFVYERFANYRGDRGAVVEDDRRAIEEFIESNPGLTRVTCVGSTSGVPALSTDPALAKARAANACGVVEELVPGVTTREALVTGRGIGQFHRAVIIYGVGNR